MCPLLAFLITWLCSQQCPHLTESLWTRYVTFLGGCILFHLENENVICLFLATSQEHPHFTQGKVCERFGKGLVYT